MSGLLYIPKVGDKVRCFYAAGESRDGTVEHVERSGRARVRISPAWLHTADADDLLPLPALPEPKPPRHRAVLMCMAALWIGVIAYVGVHSPEAFAADAEPVRTGEHVTYTDQAGAKWCATVQAVQPLGGEAMAWFTIDADPRRGFHAPVAELVKGCTR